jgi:hypothetical protein
LLTGTLIVALLALVWATAPGAARGQGGIGVVTPTPLASPHFTVTPPAPAPTAVAPRDATAFTPGTAYLLPGNSVSFLDQAHHQPGDTPAGPRLLKVLDEGSDTASVAFDGLTLVVTGGGYPHRAAVTVQAPDVACTSLDADSASVGCTPIYGNPSLIVTFSTSPLPSAQPGAPYLPVDTFQALAAPGEDMIGPRADELVLSATSILTSASQNGSVQPYALSVRNDGLDPFVLVDDGASLTLSGPAGDVLVATGESELVAESPGNVRVPIVCTAGDTQNVLICPAPAPPATLDLLAQPAESFVAAGDTTLFLGQNAAFPAEISAAGDRPLVVRYLQPPLLFRPPPPAANAVNVSWDGATLKVVGPPSAWVSLTCTPPGLPPAPAENSASCDLSQSAQTLVTVTTVLPTLLGPGGPPPRQPAWGPVILSVPESGSVGDALSFVGSVGDLYQGTVDGPFAYFWIWGDGTLDTGAYATHSYAAAGDYTVAFVAIDLHDGTTQATTTTVTIAGS